LNYFIYFFSKGIAAILGDLLGLARRLINDPLKTHIRALLGLAPKTCKLQRFDYGVEGGKWKCENIMTIFRQFAIFPPSIAGHFRLSSVEERILPISP
jgi:hypothetical protein